MITEQASPTVKPDTAVRPSPAGTKVASPPQVPVNEHAQRLGRASGRRTGAAAIACVEDLLEAIDDGLDVTEMFRRMRGLNASRIARMIDSRKFREYMEVRRRLADEITATLAAEAVPFAVEQLQRLMLSDNPETSRKACLMLVRLGIIAEKAKAARQREEGGVIAGVGLAAGAPLSASMAAAKGAAAMPPAAPSPAARNGSAPFPAVPAGSGQDAAIGCNTLPKRGLQPEPAAAGQAASIAAKPQSPTVAKPSATPIPAPIPKPAKVKHSPNADKAANAFMQSLEARLQKP